MKHKVSCYVKCPFYRCEEDQRIYCEGVQRGTSLHLVFMSHPALRRYKDRRCKARWDTCMIAGMLNRKYTE